jgi:hypothetical protein
MRATVKEVPLEDFKIVFANYRGSVSKIVREWTTSIYYATKIKMDVSWAKNAHQNTRLRIVCKVISLLISKNTCSTDVTISNP